MKNLKIIFLFVCILVLAIYFGVKFFWKIPQNVPLALSGKVWPTQSIDTVKYSRDLAREKLNDRIFETDIEKQVSDIASTGATHIAVGTPYDEEFVPYLTTWVKYARKYKLNVWFRGNLSGWEGWFSYPKISRDEHTEKVVSFVKKHPNLFNDGDIFTSCPECENGAGGDPRLNGDVLGFRKFLIEENNKLRIAFKEINKSVVSGYYSMNGDVAKLVMDKDTTKSLGGVSVIDHYVSTPDKLIEYIDNLAQTSGGKIVLGEWGAPIPDINGQMSEEEQAQWIETALDKLTKNKNVVGLNYWTNKGGSTAIWSDTGAPKKAVAILTQFYTPREISGSIENEVGNAIYGASVASQNGSITTDYGGRFRLEILPDDKELTIKGVGYAVKSVKIDDNDFYTVTLVKDKENIFFRFAKWFHQQLN